MNGKPQPLLYSRVPRDELKRPDGPMPTLPRLKGMSVFWVHLVAPLPLLTAPLLQQLCLCMNDER